MYADIRLGHSIQSIFNCLKTRTGTSKRGPLPYDLSDLAVFCCAYRKNAAHT